MAGDWIKIEHALPDKPECIQIAGRLSVDQDAVAGKLLRLWIWADQQTIDGNAPGVTPAFIDRLTNCPGFSAALLDVGWLVDRNGRLQLPNFDRHNGQTAKQRALTASRVKRSRNGASVTESLPEKRREDIPPPAPDEPAFGLLLDPQRFLEVFNANTYTRKAGPLFTQLPLQHELSRRLANPNWVASYERALAKLPLRYFADDPSVSYKWFIQEDTVGLILSGEWDCEKGGSGGTRKKKPKFDLDSALEAISND